MSSFEQLYLSMKDGTIKQKNPFTGTEVWYVPGRDSRPMKNPNIHERLNIKGKVEDEGCSFCYPNYLETTPEKSRVVKHDNNYHYVYHIEPQNLLKDRAKFRRISNLYEIVRYDYWEKNYDYILSDENKTWKDNYINNPQGLNHLKHIVRTKLSSIGLNNDEIVKKINDEKEFDKLINPFFGGSHELIIADEHYKENAEFKKDLLSSGELTPEEHYQYYKFTIEAIKSIYNNNRFVRYVTVFQNWLEQAGASLKHLHRQLVGLDEWGSSVEKQIVEVRKNKNIYNEYGPNFAIFHDLEFLENDYAVAFADYGRRFPTIAIYSKSINTRPFEQTDEEIRGISDIVHAVHCAMENTIASNEEWYYTPVDAIDVIPFHILIKWRTVTPAGFEGGTKIFINPISPIHVRDTLVPQLFKLRDMGKVGDVRIAEECGVQYNMLQYYKNKT